MFSQVDGHNDFLFFEEVGLGLLLLLVVVVVVVVVFGKEDGVRFIGKSKKKKKCNNNRSDKSIKNVQITKILFQKKK